MHRAAISLVVTLVVSAAVMRSSAQDATAAEEQVVTERLAYPYSIDLLPDDPAAPPFEAVPGAAAGPPRDGGDTFGAKTVTGDLFDRWLSTKESGITFGGRITQFAFGLAGGIDQPVPPPLGQGDVFKYTGRSEYDAVFDLEKFGGLPHGRLLVRAELLTAVENDSAGAVSRRSKTTAHNRAVLCEGRIGAIAPIPPPFRGSHRSAQRHGDVERDTT